MSGCAIAAAASGSGRSASRTALEEPARADDVGQRDAQVGQLVRRNAVQRRERTRAQAHADGLVARLEPRDQHRAQRADDVAVDDVHAAVGQHAQRRRAHAAQMPEGLDPGREVAGRGRARCTRRRRRRGRSPAAVGGKATAHARDSTGDMSVSSKARGRAARSLAAWTNASTSSPSASTTSRAPAPSTSSSAGSSPSPTATS